MIEIGPNLAAVLGGLLACFAFVAYVWAITR
jgi:hypothetical protein